MILNRKYLLPWIVAAVLLMSAGFVLIRQSKTISNQAGLLSRDAAENDQLRRQLRDLSAARAPAATPAPIVPPTVHERGGESNESLATAEQRATRLRESLVESTAQIERLDSEIAELRSRVDAANEDNHRLSATVESGKQSLADANQTLESLRNDLKTYSSRVSELEKANANAKQDTAAQKQTAEQLHQTVSDLEGIFRRRDTFVSNILVRYREITDQYRSMAGVMDTRRDRPSSAVSSPEISRIQNAIALADEDLKQVHALSAQAQRLEKKLTGR